jgi:hypothetical protein
VDLATAGFDQAARPVIVVLAVVTALTVLLGFLPQLMLRAAELAFP